MMPYRLSRWTFSSGLNTRTVLYACASVSTGVNTTGMISDVLWSLLTLDLSSSRVKDTLGHTSTPAFSVDSELLRYFPGHADAFQILLYGVYPVLSWSSRLSLSTHLYPSVQLVLAVCCHPFVERAWAISVFSLLWWDLSYPAVSAPWSSCDWLSFHETPIIHLGTCGVWLLACSFAQLLQATVLVTSEINNNKVLVGNGSKQLQN